MDNCQRLEGSDDKGNHKGSKRWSAKEDRCVGRGRPSLLPDSVTADIKCYIRALRDAGGVVNTAIVLAAATGILQRKDPTSLGGHIILKKSWAKYLLKILSSAVQQPNMRRTYTTLTT